MQEIEENIHAEASAIVDPKTGKHAEVIVRRASEDSLLLTTNGSDAFARELEKRLGFDEGDVQTESLKTPNIYLAHASENKSTLAEPLAKKLIDCGIDVWLDKWEIGYGDSLIQKMEQGLDGCSHFVVLLTPESIQKDWVRAEIDAGFMNDVDGKSKFIGLRSGVQIDELTTFLRTRLCPDFDLSNDDQFEDLVADIFGLSRKPELGNPPSFVQNQKSGLSGWSEEAVILAKHLVNISKTACKFDPQTNYKECAEALDQSEEIIRLGVLDLEGAGLIEKRDTFSSSSFHPLIGLFVEFDRHFKEFNNRDDALEIAKLAYESGSSSIDIGKLKKEFSGWSLRRFNSALNVLEELKAIKAARHHGGGGFTYQLMRVDDKTLRFIRRNS